MSFWTTTDNQNAATADGNFNAGGGNIEPIPANTQVKAAIDEAKWDAYEGDQYISLRWTVLAPEEYKNRKVFQKVRVYDSSDKKSDKAKRMLAAIATNCGGGLLRVQGEPTDMDLQSNLLMKPMALTLQVWETEDKSNSGNWVQQVAPLTQSAPKQQATRSPQQPALDNNDPGF